MVVIGVVVVAMDEGGGFGGGDGGCCEVVVGVVRAPGVEWVAGGGEGERHDMGSVAPGVQQCDGGVPCVAEVRLMDCGDAVVGGGAAVVRVGAEVTVAVS